MLPAIPNRFSTLDASLIADHFRLEAGDDCIYIWEYARRSGYTQSPVNGLMLNFKRAPLDGAEDPRKAAYKRRAIAHCAEALRVLIEPGWFDRDATIVPVPPSKASGHPNHDDRLQRTLMLAAAGYDADIRPLICQTRSTCADHEAITRLSLRDLRSITRLDERLASQSVRSTLVVFDDVLNSGKHFKIAKELLHRRFPRRTILGVFLARCLPARVVPDRRTVVP